LLLGLVLAGGRSERFGSPKALVRVGGETFLERVIHALEPVAGEVAVSASEATPPEALEAARRLGATLIEDDPTLPCWGPPRGVVSAYRAARPGALLVVGVDYPFIEAGALESVVYYARALRAAALTPMLHRGYPLVTVGYAARESLETLARACRVKRRARLTDLYRAPGSVVTGWSLHAERPQVFVNVNTPRDLERSTRIEADRDSSITLVEGAHYARHLAALERLDTIAAREYLLLEAFDHGSKGLTLFETHALRDYSLLSLDASA
jgi:molybdopterin-guanine dinucleotide biosynthesis protein A